LSGVFDICSEQELELIDSHSKLDSSCMLIWTEKGARTVWPSHSWYAKIWYTDYESWAISAKMYCIKGYRTFADI